MSTSSANMTVGGINIDVVFKDIKNLHIGVYPPVGRVRVAAPESLDDDAVRLAVVQRLPWIKKQRQQLRSAVRQSEREMVTGEAHYYAGSRYRMKVVERPGRGHVEITGDRMILYAAEGTSVEQRQALLDRWYRARLREAISPLITKYEAIMGVKVTHWSIRKMKTKWGSCNRETGHIWFNVELAKKHPESVEYLVVHEMTHLLERGHGDRFTTLMDGFLPDWRARRDQLNSAPMSAQRWEA